MSIVVVLPDDPWEALNRVSNLANETVERRQAAWEAMVRKFPQFPIASVGLSDHFRGRGMFDQAEVALIPALASDIPSEWALKSHAEIAQQRGDTAVAFMRWQRLLEAYPNFVAARVSYASWMRHLGRLDECATQLNLALRLAPNDEWVIKGAAELAETLGDLTGALMGWRALQAVRPLTWFGYEGELRCLAKQQGMAQAVERHAELIRRFHRAPQWVRWLNDLLGDLQHAFGDVPVELGASPPMLARREEDEVGKAVGLLSAQMTAEAEYVIRQGLDAHGESLELLKLWVVQASDCGNGERVLGRLAVMRKFHPTYWPGIIQAMGQAQRIGMPRMAEQVAKQAISAGCDPAILLIPRLDALLVAGEHAAAATLLAHLGNVGSNPDERETIARLIWRLLRGNARESVREQVFALALSATLNDDPMPLVCRFVDSLCPGDPRHIEVARWCQALLSKGHAPVLAWVVAMRYRPDLKMQFHESMPAPEPWKRWCTLPIAAKSREALPRAEILRVIKLSAPPAGEATLAIQLACDEWERCLDALNQFTADRTLRAYQKSIYQTGGFGAAIGISGRELQFGGTIFCSVPKAFAWRFAHDNEEVWLLSGGCGEAFEINSVYLRTHRLLLSSILNNNEVPSGDLSWLMQQIEHHAPRLPAPGGECAPRLVVGHPNYAHSLWNEYPALIELESRIPFHNLDIWVMAEPFAPHERLFLSPGGAKTIKLAPSQIPIFSPELLWSAGSNRVGAEARKRILADLMADLQVVGRPRDYFAVWFSLRSMYRHAVNENEGLLAIMRRLNRANEKFLIILDGFSLSDDLNFPGRYNIEYLKDHAAKTVALAQQLREACDTEHLSRITIWDTTSCNLRESLCAAAYADYYFCHHGTQQHKIAWLYDIPGMIHANPNITANANGQWPQDQAGHYSLPAYLPARFIGDAESGGERQHIENFRDYQFVDLDAMADYVVSDILTQLRRKRELGGNPL